MSARSPFQARPKTQASSHAITAQHAELLLGILNENRLHVMTLNKLLQVERARLEQRQRQQLTEVLEEKAQCLQKIGSTEQRLEQLLLKLCRNLRISDSSGPTKNQALIDADTIETIIARCPTQYQPNLLKTWEQLKEALQECQALNAINGQIIHKSKNNVEAILSMMRGYSAQTTRYQADGHKEQHSEQRTLAKA